MKTRIGCLKDRGLVLISLLAVSILARAGGRPSVVASVDVGDRKQLFIDDQVVETVQAVSRVLNRPEKYEGNPIFKAERSWEGNLVGLTSVIYDDEEKIFKMWYSARKITAQRPPGPLEEHENLFRASKYKEELNYECFALSRDGIHWERPELGVVEFEGSTKNNILPVDRTMGWLGMMYKDAHEKNPERRYKGVGSWILVDGRLQAGVSRKGSRGVGVFFSPDGIRSTPYAGNPVLQGAGDNLHTVIGWDDRIHRYVGYFRPGWNDDQPAFERLSPPAGRLRVRTIGYSTSDDFIHWTPLEPALVPDSKDPVDLQFYGMPAIKYEGYYLGFPWLFRTHRLTMESGFAYSRDGKTFLRPEDRAAFIPLGAKGTWESACIYISRPIVHQDRLWFYYQAMNWAHSVADFLAVGERAGGAVGIATLPLDGFVSLDAGPNPGTITTRPLVFKGSRLLVNFEASLKGSAGVDDASSLQVEVLDPRGRPIQGFGRDEAQTITRTGLRHSVAWKAGTRLASQEGRPVRLRFHLRNAKLYSFQFVSASPS